MWAMLQHDEPDDYVLATGTAYCIRDFLGFAFDHVGLDWEKYVKFDERYLRPAEVDSLIGDASRAASILKWKPKVMTPDLARIMVDSDCAAAARLQGACQRSPGACPVNGDDTDATYR
jgi:GDPmannose 4,6-dehydratase